MRWFSKRLEQIASTCGKDFAIPPPPAVAASLPLPRRRVGRRKPGADFLLPGAEAGGHGLDAIRFCCGEVVFFAGVGFQVIEFVALAFEEVDEFPVAFPHRGAGGAALVAVVGVVPEEGAGGEGFAAEQRGDADAVAVLRRAEGLAGEVEEGRVAVGADDGHVAGDAAAGVAWEAVDQGHAAAGFV